MDITLTISLLASNRKDSLNRCLDSLKPLLVKIPCELIVVLTDPDAEVREIAEKYTPQIIPFKWCNDFSAARNAGLKAARGEWFLYIDDDEWFDDTDEICGFFLSGEYRHYHSAHYIQRNYQNWNGTQYSDFSAFRMVQRLPESHFHGAIHEELSPRMEPCKYFQAFVHHYGYADNGAAAKKSSRNIPLLLQSIEAHPSHVKNYLQIAKEYGLQGNWRPAEEYCRKGLDICRKCDDPYSINWLKAYLSYLAGKKPGKKQAIQELERILEQEHPAELTRLILYQQLIHLYTEEQEHGKAVWYGRKFEGLLEEMDSQPVLWKEQSYGEFCENFVKSPERLYGARADCTECALELQDYEGAVYFLKLFPWDTEDILQRYYPDFERWKVKYPMLFMDAIAGRENNHLPTYLLLQKALDCLARGKSEEGTRLFVHCVTLADNACLQQILLKEAVLHKMGLLPLAAKMHLESWNSCTANIAEEFPYSIAEQIRKCESELQEAYRLHSLCLKKHRLRLMLSKGFPLWDELIETLKQYCLCITDFYAGLYREEMFQEGNNAYLPEECRFALAALKALEHLGLEQIPEAIRLFGDALHINPDMTGAVTEVFRQAMSRTAGSNRHMGQEFFQLAGQMKETLHTLLETGQTAQAAAILEQLLPLMPEDQELIWIRQELIRRTMP